MQCHTFSNGGFVIHKIPFNGGKLSAWFDADRNLLDIEKFDRNGRKTGAGIYPAMVFARSFGQYINPKLWEK